MTKTTAALLATLAGLVQPSMAWSQETGDSRASYTVGLRVWNAAWSTAVPTVYNTAPPGGPQVLAESLDSVDGKRRTEAYPSIAMRKDKFVVSASYARFSTDFHVTNSVYAPPSGGNVLTSRTDHLDRKESDITVGYLVVPNVAVSLGFKYADEGRETTLGLTGMREKVVDNTARVLLLGAAAAFPIQGNLQFTGQIAYGPGRIKTRPLSSATLVPAGTNSARYLISEIGLAYPLGLKSAYFRGVSVGLSYRTQLVKTKLSGPAARGGRTYRDERDGLVATLNFTI